MAASSNAIRSDFVSAGVIDHHRRFSEKYRLDTFQKQNQVYPIRLLHIVPRSRLEPRRRLGVIDRLASSEQQRGASLK